MPSTPSGKPRWSRKKRLFLVYLPIALVLYTLFGFFAVPLIIRKVIVPQVQKRLNATITLDKAYTNPFSFYLALHKLEVRDLAGEKVFAFDEFNTNFQPFGTIFSRGWNFDSVRVVAPFIRARIEADGSSTLAKLIKPVPVDPNAKPQEPLKRLPRLVVRELSVEKGEADLKDLSTPKPFEREIHGASFRITNVDTNPDYVNPMKIEFSTDEGAKITWTGTLQVNPLTSKGEIEAVDIHPARFMPYVMRYTDISLEGAKLAVKLSYEFAPAASPRVAKFHVSTATLQTPKLIVPWQDIIKGRADASASKITITDINADADARSIAIAKIEVEGGDSLLELSKGRTVPQRIADALLSEAHETLEPPSVEPTAREDVAAIPYPVVRLLTGLKQLLSDIKNPWAIELTSLDVVHHRSAFADLSAPQAVKLALSDVAIHAGPIKSTDHFLTPFTLNVTFEKQGKAAIKGSIKPLDQVIQGHIEASDLDAALASPYIPASALAPLPPARLGNSILTLNGDFRAELPPPGGAKSTWKGRTRIEPLTFESTERDLVLGAKSLDIESDATLNTTAAADIDIMWKGNIKGQDVTAGGPLPQTGATKVSMQKFEIQGEAALARSSTGAIKIAYKGDAALGGVIASASEAYGPVTASIGGTTFSGDLAVAGAPGSSPALTVSGNASASDVQANSEKLGRTALTVAGAKADALNLDTHAKSVAATLVSVDGLALKGSPPIIPPEGFTKEPPSDRGKFTLAGLIPFNIAVERFELSGGTLDLTDSSTSPATVIAANDINVSIVPLSTAPGTPSELNVTASVNGSGKLAVTGALEAFAESPTADIKIALASIPLPPYSGPTGRFLGYEMADGRMTTQIPFQIENEKLKGEIDFAFDHLKLGEKVKSEDAIDAPLELGLALLRDSNDQIKSKIPFSGDLNDPKFRLGGVIWQAFSGLLVKAATAPFQILGAMFGGGDQDLSQVFFAAGSFELTPQSISALDTLAKGLTDRPGISLAVRGQVEPESDGLELRRQILRERYAENIFGKGKTSQKLSDQQLKDQTMIAFDQLQVEKARAANQTPPPSVRRVGSGVAPPPPVEEMEAALVEATELPPERLADLAKKRADAVVDFLIKEKKIAASRVKAAEPDPKKQDSEKPRAVFEVYK